VKILIAEDNNVTRLLLQKLMRGFEVHSVVTGVEALEAVKISYEEENPYDIIFMDIMMPEMDGLESVKNIRALEMKIGIKIPMNIIMLTACNNEGNVTQAQTSGCNGYVVKPLSKKRLFYEVDKVRYQQWTGVR